MEAPKQSLFKASDYEVEVRKEAALFDLPALPEDLRRQMKKLTYKQLEKEEHAELSAAISGFTNSLALWTESGL